MKRNKNVFVKATHYKKNKLDLGIRRENDSGSDSSIQTDDLSDELKKISGSMNIQNIHSNHSNHSNHSIQSSQMTCSNPNFSEQTNFDISLMKDDISKCLNKYNTCEITGEIISFKITDGNAWLTIKSQGFQLTGTFWNISIHKNYEKFKSFKQGEQVIFAGKFSLMKNLTI